MDDLRSLKVPKYPNPFPFGAYRVIDTSSGTEVPLVYECDVDAGICRCFAAGRDGRPFYDESADDAARVELRGQFKIVRVQ